MSTARLTVAACLLLAWAGSAVSQGDTPESYSFPTPQSYAKAKLYLTNGTRLEVSDFTIEKDIMTYRAPGGAQTDNLSLDYADVVKVSEGTHAGAYALYGGAVFGLSALLGIAQAESDPYTDVEINKPLFIGGFAAAGVLLGGLVGSTQHRWKTLYSKERTDSRAPAQILIALEPGTSRMRLALSFGL